MTAKEYLESQRIDTSDIVCYSTPSGTENPIDFCPIEMAEEYADLKAKEAYEAGCRIGMDAMDSVWKGDDYEEKAINYEQWKQQTKKQ